VPERRVGRDAGAHAVRRSGAARLVRAILRRRARYRWLTRRGSFDVFHPTKVAHRALAKSAAAVFTSEVHEDL
jgi:hypothetical protein